MAMTRQEIIKQYDVAENGRITSLGKFEQEMIYVPYFYDLIGDNSYDNWDMVDDITHFYFYITEEDIKQFPELKDAKEVTIREDSDGFVHCNVD